MMRISPSFTAEECSVMPLRILKVPSGLWVDISVQTRKWRLAPAWTVYSPPSPTVTLRSCRDASPSSNCILSTTEPSLFTCALPSSNVYTALFSPCLSTTFHSMVSVLHSASLGSLSKRQLRVTSASTKTLILLILYRARESFKIVLSLSGLDEERLVPTHSTDHHPSIDLFLPLNRTSSNFLMTSEDFLDAAT
ncbi:hypothetical protein EYF80_001474 [Liparis tanakae]|uniref:Uncharacterized protein n=1 Tax=Liparis tanakae TaxID=230148 RepID=A0A4Z2JF58_9TELE|nr:hypothetical protein EYF80_001474 [Liparis tanakae]